MIGPDVDVPADLAAINRGEAERHGDTYTLRETGRRWGQGASGTSYPIDGPGFYPMNRAAYKVLQLLNTHGDGEHAANQIAHDPHITPEDEAEGRRIWLIGQSKRGTRNGGGN